MSARPHVLLILADDLGSWDLGCYGATDLVTPHLDRLAESGVRFTDFYANATVGIPSRASLLTGRYFARAAVPGVGLAAREVTLADLFRQAGYRTALFGKWGLGTGPETNPMAQGFQRFVGHHTPSIDAYSHFAHEEDFSQHALIRGLQPYRAPGRYLPDLLVDEARAFLDEDRADPYFLFLALPIPHFPVQPRSEHRRRYLEMKLEDPRRVLYGAYVTTLDDCVGQILEAASARGDGERTVVLFLSDNGHSVEVRALGGGGSSGPFRGHKETLWEGGIRVPCIAAWPGQIPAGETRQQPAMAMDWLPTLAEICQLQAPEDRAIDGRSLASLLASATASSPHERLHWAHYNGSFAVREGRWKLHSRKRDDLWLCDLHSDPGERTNLAEAEGPRVRRLATDHNRWLREVMDDAPEARERRGR